MTDEVSSRSDDFVRCIACGRVYELPARAGMQDAEPGCPQCGSVSWIAVALPRRRQAAAPRRG